MAKIKLGALANDVRGSVAGQTFSRGRYGATVRQKVSGVQPRTQRQLTVRAAFTIASQAWRALSAANMAAWNAYAANHPVTDVFGDSQTLAGNAAYCRHAANCAVLGLAAPTSPPADGLVFPAAALSAEADASTGDVVVTTAAQSATSGKYQIWTTPGVSLGATPGQGACRLAGVHTATATDTQATVVPATFNPKLGFIAGQKLIVFVVRCDTGGVIKDSMRFDIVAS